MIPVDKTAPAEARQRPAQHPPQPKRRREQGPIGFSAVFRSVRRTKAPMVESGAGRAVGSIKPERDAKVDAGALLALMSPNPSSILGDHAAGAVEALGSGTLSAAAQRAELESGRVTPEQAMELASMHAAELEEGDRTLRLQLHPDHLGPLVIELRREGRKLRILMSASDERATALLGSELESLKNSLAELGFTAPELHVEQRESAFFTGGMGPEGPAGEVMAG